MLLSHSAYLYHVEAEYVVLCPKYHHWLPRGTQQIHFKTQTCWQGGGDVCGHGKELIIHIRTGCAAWNLNFGVTTVPSQRKRSLFDKKGMLSFL